MKKVHFCEKTGLKRGKWSHEEDHQLIAYIQRHGIWNWKEMAKAARLLRTGKSCRLRWMNYLKPDLKHGSFTKEEDKIIIQMYKAMGSKWSRIAAKLPGRSDNEIKNHWHTNLRKQGRRRNKSMRRDHHTRVNENNVSITMANSGEQCNNNNNNLELIGSLEPPLSVEDYEIDEMLNLEMEGIPTSSDSSPCSSIHDDQNEIGYWDMLLVMISENQFPIFEGPFQELFTNSELYFQI